MLAVRPALPLSLAAIILCLTACAGPQPNPPKQSAAPKPPVATALPAPIPAPSPEPRFNVNKSVQRLLADAETALAADMLTTPIHDNAFDRYKAVLLLQPGNQQAESGLQEIFARYSSKIRGDIVQGDLGNAEELLERARMVDANNPQIAELSRQINEKRRQMRAARPAKPVQPNGNEVLLDTRLLSARNQEITDELQKLAVSVKEKDESVLIYARNDEEGRWIYRQMALGVMGYRLRGDMRIGSSPKIVILPPIEEAL